MLTILTLTLGYGAHHPCADSAPAGHEDSLVATLKRSRIATRRLGLDRMLAGKARSIAAMRWRGVALAQGTLGGGNIRLPRTITDKLAVRNAFESKFYRKGNAKEPCFPDWFPIYHLKLVTPRASCTRASPMDLNSSDESDTEAAVVVNAPPGSSPPPSTALVVAPAWHRLTSYLEAHGGSAALVSGWRTRSGKRASGGGKRGSSKPHDVYYCMRQRARTLD